MEAFQEGVWILPAGLAPKDPTYALAYVGLANTYTYLLVFRVFPS